MKLRSPHSVMNFQNHLMMSTKPFNDTTMRFGDCFELFECQIQNKSLFGWNHFLKLAHPFLSADWTLLIKNKKPLIFEVVSKFQAPDKCSVKWRRTNTKQGRVQTTVTRLYSNSMWLVEEFLCAADGESALKLNCNMSQIFRNVNTDKHNWHGFI